MTDNTLSGLARAKAAFQQRTLVAILAPNAASLAEQQERIAERRKNSGDT